MYDLDEGRGDVLYKIIINETNLHGVWGEEAVDHGGA